MSKFIEVEDTLGYKVIVNVDSISHITLDTGCGGEQYTGLHIKGMDNSLSVKNSYNDLKDFLGVK